MENVNTNEERIFNALERIAKNICVKLSSGCKWMAVFLVLYAFGEEAYHCIFTAAMYLGMSYLIKHIND